MNTEHISDLLDIYERFGDNAQKALDFVKKNIAKVTPVLRTAPLQPYVPNGVYFIFNDDYYVLASDHISMDASNSRIKAIGIAHDGHCFSVPLDWNYGESSLLKKDEHHEDECCQREIEAIMDWDFVKHTNHLKELGLAIDLKEGHYLPTIPVFGAMYKNRKYLNVALITAGTEGIDFDKDFWFAQRRNFYEVWFFDGESHTFYLNNASEEYHVVSVSPWEPKA